MNTIPIYSQFILTIPKAVALGMLIGLNLILIPGTSDRDGNIFNPYNIILLILGSWGVSCVVIRFLYDTQKLTKLSFVFSLAMGLIITICIIYLAHFTVQNK